MRTVVKVGTSTLTYENGKMNYRRVEALCKVLCDLHNSGEDILLVSSGAIGVGMGKTGLSRRPESTKKKQALAAIGQCELMFMYDKLFGEYNHNVAQILLTADVVEADHTRQNIANTIEELLEMDIIPIINENDTVAIDEIYGNNIGDNDMLQENRLRDTRNGGGFRLQPRHRRYDNEITGGKLRDKMRHRGARRQRIRPCDTVQGF